MMQQQTGEDEGVKALMAALLARGMTPEQAMLAIQEIMQGPRPMLPQELMQPQGIGLGR